MNVIASVLFTTVLGAVIGGYTNSVAIKMLFRPYNPMYIGKYKVPFTPGVIPKRRTEVAEQLGQMVTEHLLTPEVFEKKLQQPEVKEQLIAFIAMELENALHSEEKIIVILEKLGIKDVSRLMEDKLNRIMVDNISVFLQKNRQKKLAAFLSEEFSHKIEGKFPLVADYTLEKAVTYIESPEGKEQVNKMVNEFLARKGMVGGFAQMILGNTSLGDKVHPEIVNFLRNEETKQTLVSILEKEWSNVQQWEVEKLEQYIEVEAVSSYVTSLVMENVETQFLQKNVKEVMLPYEKKIHQALPHLVDKALGYVIKNTQNILGKLEVSELVREQIDSFSTEKLEEMVIDIAKNELKMITYLGAFLGGLIGLVQGIILAFLA